STGLRRPARSASSARPSVPRLLRVCSLDWRLARNANPAARWLRLKERLLPPLSGRRVGKIRSCALLLGGLVKYPGQAFTGRRSAKRTATWLGLRQSILDIE